MAGQQFGFKGIGVIKVDFGALGWRQAGQVFVVRIVLDKSDPFGPTRCRISWATVVLPEPEPPAMPITRGVSCAMGELYPLNLELCHFDDRREEKSSKQCVSDFSLRSNDRRMVKQIF
jgi:hypothetical protein